MSAKRSACDRCHKMKMQCLTEGRDQSCNRCQSARIQCYYSKPGRPGRPPKTSGSVSSQRSAPHPNRSSLSEPEPAAAVIPPASGFPQADETDTWRQNTLTEHAVPPKGAGYFQEEQTAAWPLYGSFLDSSGLQLDYTDPLAEVMWPLNHAEADLCTSSTTPSEHQPVDQNIPREPEGSAMDTKPVSPILGAGENQTDGQDFIQRLAHFHVTISCMADCQGHMGLERLEQEAAHVLESTSKFLELIRVLANEAEAGRHKHRAPGAGSGPGPQEPSPFNAAVFLQLTSISIRLIEMHTSLYTSIHRYLQQEPDAMSQVTTTTTTTTTGRPPAPQLLFAVAGVRLAPALDFWLPLILHTGIYYLGRMQKMLGEMEAFRVEAASEMSPVLPLQTRMLISGDQRGRMAKIRLVLAKLKDEFGICSMPWNL